MPKITYYLYIHQMNPGNENVYSFGISTTADYSVPILEQLKIYSEIGFKFVSIGANHDHAHFNSKDDFKHILKAASDHGLTVDSIHARFDRDYNLAAVNEDNRIQAVDQQKKFITRCQDFGLTRVILHPHYYFEIDPETTLEIAVISLRELLEFKPSDMHLIVENLPTADGSWFFDSLMGIFDETQIGFCYDSSHENMSGNPFHLLEKHANRLTTTHLSDNHGRFDEHLAPGDGNIDWWAMKQLLDKSSITDLLFEVGTGEHLEEGLFSLSKRTIDFARSIFT